MWTPLSGFYGITPTHITHPSQHRVAAEIEIVSFRMIAVEVKAATFLAGGRLPQDDAGDEHDVPQLQKIGIDGVPAVEPVHFFLDQAQASRRGGQALVRTDNTHVVPHEPPHRVPVVLDDYVLSLNARAGQDPGIGLRR